MAKKKVKKEKRSRLEEEVAAVLEPLGFEYESTRLAYHVPRLYTPDFTYSHVVIEVKGYFRAGDTQKYKAIRDSLVDKTFVMILQTPNKPVRKGSKLTMAEWCDRNDIEWHPADDLEELVRWALGIDEEEWECDDDDDE